MTAIACTASPIPVQTLPASTTSPWTSLATLQELSTVGGTQMSDDYDRWAWTSEEIRRVGYRVVDLIADHLNSLPSRPVFAPVPTELATAFLQEGAPQTGRDPDAILELFRSIIEPYPF